MKRFAIFFFSLCLMLLLVEKQGGREIWLSYSPFYDVTLEGMNTTERYLVNGSKKTKYWCVWEKGEVGTRKFFKLGKFKQAEKYYLGIVKKEFGLDLVPYVIGKSKIVDGKVKKTKKLKVIK